MLTIRNLDDLRAAARELGRPAGIGGVLVPTMGALHEGHAALIRRGVALAGDHGSLCAVSIFVNPTQFNDRSDFDRYPRTIEADVAMCREAGAAAVFAPDAGAMYPDDKSAPVPKLPAIATQPGLEDAHRPGHFAGVCQVVLRLFRLLEPAEAVFGEKDWQQLQVIAAMTREAGLPIRIHPHPTLRDPDGLAMSSRNRLLSGSERRAALAIPRALHAASQAADVQGAERAMREVLHAAGLKVDYAVVRDAATLGAVKEGSPARSLIAAKSGSTRLIDNGPWPG